MERIAGPDIQVVPVNQYYEFLCKPLGKKNSIDLEPAYQRDIVWNDEQKSLFIDSLIKGYVATPLILNKYTNSNGDYVNIDGKQRSYTIKQYYENKIAWKNDDNYYVYYDEIPNHKDKNKCYRIMTSDEKELFEETKLTLIYYKNLTYDIQKVIFERNTYGSSLKSGEVIRSIYKTEDTTKQLINIAEKWKKDLSKYIDKINISRGDENRIISNIIKLKNGDDLSISKKNVNDFIKNTKDSKMRIYLQELDKVFKFIFGILKTENFKGKIFEVYITVLWENYDKILHNNNWKNSCYVRKKINKILKIIEKKYKKDKKFSKIYTQEKKSIVLLKELIEDLLKDDIKDIKDIKKNKKQLKKNINEEDSESESETESESDSNTMEDDSE